MTKYIVVKCGNCKKEFNYYSSEFRPFCSEKCKMIDLGLWLTESYTVPVENLMEEMITELEEKVFSKVNESEEE